MTFAVLRRGSSDDATRNLFGIGEEAAIRRASSCDLIVPELDGGLKLY